MRIECVLTNVGDRIDSFGETVILKCLPPHCTVIREVWEVRVGLYTSGDDGDETGGEDGGHADEGDVGNLLKCAGDGQATMAVRAREFAGVRETGTYRNDTIAMMAAHAILQMAPLEMLLRAMAPERACDPATKTDCKESMSLLNMIWPWEIIRTLVTSMAPKSQKPFLPATTPPASAKFMTPGSLRRG